MATIDITAYKTPKGLHDGFYNSFTDEENFTGSDETIQWARGIVEAGDRMWNYPYAVEDAERYIAENS
jgi:hypothetical protein